MENDFLTKCYEKFPPNILIDDFFTFIEDIETEFCSTIKDFILKYKSDFILEQNPNLKNIEPNTRTVSIKFISNKDLLVQKFFGNIKISTGNFFLFPYESHITQKEKEGLILLIDIHLNNEKFAEEVLQKINKNILPFLNDFPYYKSFKKYGGELRFFSHGNKIIICITRISQAIKIFQEVLSDLNFKKFKAGYNININFSTSFSLYDLKDDTTVDDFIQKISSFQIKLNADFINVKHIFKGLEEYLEDKKEDYLIKFLLNFIIKKQLYLTKSEIELELAPSCEYIKELLLDYIFGVDCLLSEYVDKKKQDKEVWDFLIQMLIQIIKKFDIEIDEETLSMLRIHFINPSNTLYMEIILGKDIINTLV